MKPSLEAQPISNDDPAFVGRLAIRHNFIWALCGNLFVGAAQVGTLCLLAKVCSTHTVGQYALGLALINPVFALCSLQLRLILASDADQHRSFGTYFAVRLMTSSIALLTILILGLVNSDSTTIVWVIAALALSKLFVALSDLFYGLMHRCERMDCIAKSQILSGVAQLLVLTAAIVLTNSLVIACFCLAAVTMTTLLLYDLPTTRWLHTKTSSPSGLGQVTPEWNSTQIKKLIAFALAPGIMVGIVSLTISMPRGFIAQYVDVSAVGIFVALLCPGIVLQQTVLALAQAALPRLSQYYLQRNAPPFRRLLLRVLTVNALAGIGGLIASLLIGRELLSLLFRVEFVAHFDAFIWIMVASAINCLSGMGAVLTASGRFRTQLAVALVSLGTMITVCAALIPSYGIYGAAVSLVIVATIRFLLISVCVAHVVWDVHKAASPVSARRDTATVPQAGQREGRYSQVSPSLSR